MRIKRILSLALCLVMACIALVGCGDTPIGDYLKHYDYEPEKIVNMDFDLYIIVGEGTDEMAKTTVNDKINQHLNDKFHTKLNIHYLTAAEYAEEVTKAVEGSAQSTHIIHDTENTRIKAGKIVLVTGEAMMASFVDSGKLYNLSDFLTTNDFGTLNTQIPEVLVDAARNDAGELYCIPNNHVIGEYEYVCINREAALKHNYSDRTELREIVSEEDIVELRNVIGVDNVEVVTGPYELRAEKEAAGWICNISKYPEADSAEAFSSAFAVIPEATVFFDVNEDGKIDVNDYKDADKNGSISEEEKALSCIADINEVARRAMEVVYSINADTVLRNYLQYGVEHTNYVVVDGHVEYITLEDSKYYMPLEYTGDIFKANFIKVDYKNDSWTESMYNNGKAQNNDAK